MSLRSIYHWDFDRRMPNAEAAFVTFSIAIFQWQPKASGKGLKKVNASRVCGYGLDPQRMYAKAQEICDRLNSEGASVTKRPSWLQKQYSVPKPTELIIPRVGSDLPGSVVRSIRQAVMKRILLPAGFVRGKSGTYVRQQGNQIHLIDFQAAMFGHQYTVNLGFHYAFLTSLSARKKIRLADYHVLDCGLSARIGQFQKGNRDRWFDYGTDRALLERLFKENAADCLQILTTASKRFADPRRLLVREGCEINKRFIKPWHVLSGAFGPILAVHVGRKKEAIKAVSRLIEQNEGGLREFYENLLAQLDRL
jgi:Domain of unknown function (DUF4304)